MTATRATATKAAATKAPAPKKATAKPAASSTSAKPAPPKKAAPAKSATFADDTATGPEPIIAERTLAALDGGTSVPAGARRVRRNRHGALVASVNTAEAGWSSTVDAPWSAVCLTHGTTFDCADRRSAATALAHSDVWCSACKRAASAANA